MMDDFDRKVRNVLGTSEDSKRKVGESLSALAHDYHIDLPDKTKQAYGIERKFKMTFANSWWQCLVALLLYIPVVKLITIAALLALYAIGLSGNASLTQDVQDFGFIIALPLMYLLARHLSYQSWKRHGSYR